MRTVQQRKVWVFQPPIDGTGAVFGGNKQFACLRGITDVVIHFIFGNLAADGTITLQQAKNVGGNGAKALAFDTIWLTKSDAGAPEDQDKPVRTTVAANSFTAAAASMDNTHMQIEMHVSQLDVQNGFDCIRPNFAGGAGASLVCIIIEGRNPRYTGAESDLNVSPSMLDQT